MQRHGLTHLGRVQAGCVDHRAANAAGRLELARLLRAAASSGASGTSLRHAYATRVRARLRPQASSAGIEMG